MSTENKTPSEILQKAKDLFDERSAQYGNNYERVGKIIEILFPEGVSLRNAKEIERFHIFQYLIAKISRYCYNYSDLEKHEETCEDSIFDLTVYCSILSSIDKEIINLNKKNK
jgi:hypothetical protein